MNLFKKILPFISILILIIYLTFFSNKRNLNRNIESLNISFYNERSNFLNENNIIEKFNLNDLIKKKNKKNKICLDSIESLIMKNDYVNDVTLYYTFDSKLNIEINEKIPLLEVQSNQKYYLDESGKSFPILKNNPFKLPVVKGEINKDNFLDIIKFYQTISKSDFLKNELIEIFYNPNDYKIRLKSYDFIVEWGQNKSFNRKLKKLLVFCNYLKNDKKQSVYRNVNLKFKNQVVTTS